MAPPNTPGGSGDGSRIVVIGAGPSGLATAYFLKKRGYRNVLVLEKLGRVGGLCDTVTCGRYSFDLGANYVTPAYREVLRMAGEVGAKLYSERPFVAMQLPTDGGKPEYTSMFDAVRVDERTGEPIGVLRFLWLLAKYTWIRWRLGPVVDRPTMAGVEHHPDVCQPFGDWLAHHGLEPLTRLFELPVTMMGYGTIDGTPALYALKFMTVRTFVPMAAKEAPIIGKYTGWPKRFVFGFQRFWERISWELEVRLDVHVQEVVREPGRPIVVRYSTAGQNLNELEPEMGEIECDHLVVACPQTALLGGSRVAHDGQASEPRESFMKLTPDERRLFEKIHEVWYCMVTYNVEGLSFQGESPLAAVYPMAPVLWPRGVAKQWSDCELVQYYTPIAFPDVVSARAEAERQMHDGDAGARERFEDLDRVYHAMLHPEPDTDPVRDIVLEYVKRTTDQMGGTIEPSNESWHSYNRFTYFQHVDTDALLEGFYTGLEGLQGKNGTYYVGGATNFELVEPTVVYAKHLVETHFPRVA